MGGDRDRRRVRSVRRARSRCDQPRREWGSAEPCHGDPGRHAHDGTAVEGGGAAECRRRGLDAGVLRAGRAGTDDDRRARRHESPRRGGGGSLAARGGRRPAPNDEQRRPHRCCGRPTRRHVEFLDTLGAAAPDHADPGHDDAGHDDAGHDDAGHDDAGHDDAAPGDDDAAPGDDDAAAVL
ncbi:hypothetical protein E4P39_11210 [Blastococcus sp. CT_GayMR19]|nr:hypothetical protein E4P39_11210 [Blastococcus sp. CT_GayMR19]